jgi:uncharacterized integral membrane protein
VSRLAGVAGALVVLLLSLAFAAQNGSESVTLHLWFFTLYQVPLTVVTFGALLVGMLMMFVTGIQSDLKVRRILRERLAEEDREERARLLTDKNQRDLFEDRE